MKHKILTKDESIEYNTRDKLIQCFLEDWNDRNPGKKLDPETIEMIMDYLEYAYVAGWDDLRLLIEKRFKSFSNPSINKHLLLKHIYDFDKKI